MNSRYILNTASLIAGVFLLVASRVFTAGTLEWVAFGGSALVLIAGITGIGAARSRRHLFGFGVLSAVAAWSAVAALVFTGTTLGWLVFADAIAIGGVALVALALHEVSTERVVHTLEVRDQVQQAEYQAVGTF